MPILELRIVGELPVGRRARLAARLAEAAALVLGSPHGGTWVTVTDVARADYAENGGGPPAGVDPVFVRLLKRDQLEEDALESEAAALAKAVADECGRSPDHVHVIYEPRATGRVAFGGRLVRER